MVEGRRWTSAWAWCCPVWMCQTEALSQISSAELGKWHFSLTLFPSSSKSIDPPLNFPNLKSLPGTFSFFPVSCLCWGVQQCALSWLMCCDQYWSGTSSLISGGLPLPFCRSKRNHLIFSPDSLSTWIMIKTVIRDCKCLAAFKRWGDAAETSQSFKSRTTEVPLDHSKALPSLSFWRIKLRKYFDLLLLLYCSALTAECFFPAVVGFCH